ncbi:MAG: DUF1801 domain-containing protein [Thermoplasmata archaeon]|nr:DUF1801 domain-containing protein [Thermoplasmata archaeon]
MVQSAAKTVLEYVEALPPDRRPAMERLRSIAQKTLPGFVEKMQYGMPYYARAGTPPVGLGFASQREHISIYAGEAALAPHREQLKARMAGKGCVRFRRPEEIDWKLVESLFRSVAES